jgi:hypothetical protein
VLRVRYIHKSTTQQHYLQGQARQAVLGLQRHTCGWYAVVRLELIPSRCRNSFMMQAANCRPQSETIQAGTLCSQKILHM